MATLASVAASQTSRSQSDIKVISNLVQVTTGTATDVVPFIDVKKGDKILEVYISAEGTTSATVTVGDGGVAARFVSSLAHSSSAVSSLNVPTTASGGLVVNGRGYVYTADDTIDLTFGGATVSNKTYYVQVTLQRQYN